MSAVNQEIVEIKQDFSEEVFVEVTWDQVQFSFRFENNIPAGKAKRK